MEQLKYSGRTFHVSEFKFIDLDIAVGVTPSLGMLKTGESVTVVPHPNSIKELMGIWAELVPIRNLTPAAPDLAIGDDDAPTPAVERQGNGHTPAPPSR